MKLEYGTGGLESKYDWRDFWYDPTDKGAFDWNEGYDVEKDLEIKLIVRNQDGSGSCGGQAWGYQGDVLEKVAVGELEQHSARWIYSHTRVPTGGSNGRVNCKFCIDTGWVNEEFAPSYMEGGLPPNEEFMSIKPELSEAGEIDNELSHALSYVRVPTNMEVIAQAIKDNHGMVIVLNGQDNGTWRSKFPEPPTVKEWGHFVFAVGAEKIGGRKYIKIINSWGIETGEGGYQWLGSEWFKNPKLGVREGWTMQWDYEPARIKKVLIKMVKLLDRVVALYKQMLNK